MTRLLEKSREPASGTKKRWLDLCTYITLCAVCICMYVCMYVRPAQTPETFHATPSSSPAPPLPRAFRSEFAFRARTGIVGKLKKRKGNTR